MLTVLHTYSTIKCIIVKSNFTSFIQHKPIVTIYCYNNC